ncbi:hypothetical protein HK101_011465 [Irineochytrium annulatum]|nr:hypothetical protein HK101_011465 [Irineochytrium annulatum]
MPPPTPSTTRPRPHRNVLPVLRLGLILASVLALAVPACAQSSTTAPTTTTVFSLPSTITTTAAATPSPSPASGGHNHDHDADPEPLTSTAVAPPALAANAAAGSPPAVTVAAAIPTEDPVPLMVGYIHSGLVEYFLFESLVSRNLLEYILACFMTAALGVCVPALESWRRRVVRDWAVKVAEGRKAREAAAREGMKDHEIKQYEAPLFTLRAPIRFLRTLDGARERYQLKKSLIRATEVLISYFLMLLVMQFNVGFIASTVGGLFVGFYVFERTDSEEPGRLDGDGGMAGDVGLGLTADDKTSASCC